MTETVQSSAAALLSEVEKVTAVILPEPMAEVVPLEAAPAPQAEAIRQKMAEVNLANTQSIISFGSGAQAELQVISQAMLQDVKNKDVGPAGDSLRKIVTTIRGFSTDELDLRRESSWWERLLGRAAPFAEFVAKYEDVQGQIDKITSELLGHEHTLLKDIKSLDILYEKTLDLLQRAGALHCGGRSKAGRDGQPRRSPPRRPRWPPRLKLTR
jgi:uncharacterized protein YaaN involved in tellurite resistance